VGHATACLLEALTSRFPENTWLLYSHRAFRHFNTRGLVATQRLGFPVKEIWMQFWLPLLVARTRPDLCHFTNCIAPLRVPGPYVLTVHDLSLILNPEWHPRTRRAWMRRLIKPSVLRARRVICSSEATRRDLLSWVPLDPARVWTVPLAARAQFREMRPKHELDGVKTRYRLTRPFLLYVGNIEPRKNLLTLLEAFRALDAPGVDLVLAGNLAWLTAGFRREMSRPWFRDRVRLLHYVPEGLLPALYQSALAFVYPSRKEGFGLPVLEAMASGVPVVTSSVDPLSTLVGDAGWLADPDDPAAWARAMDEMIGDGAKRQALAVRARERAARYTWSATADAVMKCYESAV
jgi:glycosyltransferase involved in cell wall biosynthesis